MLLTFELMNRFPANVFYGSGAMRHLSEKMDGFREQKVMLLTDQGLLHTGIITEIKNHLSATVTVYAELNGEPKSGEVQRAVDFCRSSRFDVIVGVGGGSVLDTAKIVAVLNNSALRVDQAYGNEKVGQRDLDLILIPTTAGTGSEATPNALVFDEKSGNKEAVISQQLIPDWVVLDPALTEKLPPHITASTGMDALCHCIESFFSCNGNVISEAYAQKGLELIGASLEQAVGDGGNMEARGRMLLGSFFGGLALTIAGTTAVHALSYPLGKRGVAHGVANGMLLPSVLKFNFSTIEAKLNSIAHLFKNDDRPAVNGRELVAVIANFVKKFPIPKTLREVGISPEIIPELAAEGLKNERLLRNNPRLVSQAEAEKIYHSIQ